MRGRPTSGRATLYKLLFAIAMTAFMLYIWMHEVHLR
jgi:hypothetical protein